MKEDLLKHLLESILGRSKSARGGDEAVFKKIKVDLKDHSVSDEDIKKQMDEFNEKAKSDFA